MHNFMAIKRSLKRRFQSTGYVDEIKKMAIAI